MGDDLVKRLRDKSNIFYEYVPWHVFDNKDFLDTAADRIEELEADLRKTALDYLAADWQAEEAYKAQLAAEVKLAEALEMALDECGFRYGTDSYNNWWQERRNRVAQLKGDKQ